MFVKLPYDIASLFNTKDVYIYCFDISSFDAHVNLWFKERAWDVIREMTNITDPNPTAFDYATDNFMKISLVMPDGKLLCIYWCTIWLHVHTTRGLTCKHDVYVLCTVTPLGPHGENLCIRR